MTRPSTEQLKEKLKALVAEYNKSIDIQQKCKEAIIATQAVLKDREDGDTDNSSSDYSED